MITLFQGLVGILSKNGVGGAAGRCLQLPEGFIVVVRAEENSGHLVHPNSSGGSDPENRLSCEPFKIYASHLCLSSMPTE